MKVQAYRSWTPLNFTIQNQKRKKIKSPIYSQRITSLGYNALREHHLRVASTMSSRWLYRAELESVGSGIEPKHLVAKIGNNNYYHNRAI